MKLRLFPVQITIKMEVIWRLWYRVQEGVVNFPHQGVIKLYIDRIIQVKSICRIEWTNQGDDLVNKAVVLIENCEDGSS